VVRLVLEYASIIWSPHQIVSIDRINKVQNKYLKLVSFQNVVDSIHLKSLSERRVEFDTKFIFNLLNSHIDFLKLLSKIP